MAGLPTTPLIPNPVPQIISGPLFYIVVNGQIIGRVTNFDETHNFTLATAPEIGSIIYTEQDVMLYSGTVTLTKFAVFGHLLNQIGLVAIL